MTNISLGKAKYMHTWLSSHHQYVMYINTKLIYTIAQWDYGVHDVTLVCVTNIHQWNEDTRLFYCHNHVLIPNYVCYHSVGYIARLQYIMIRLKICHHVSARYLILCYTQSLRIYWCITEEGLCQHSQCSVYNPIRMDDDCLLLSINHVPLSNYGICSHMPNAYPCTLIYWSKFPDKLIHSILLCRKSYSTEKNVQH